MLDRASTFAHPGIVKLLQNDFVPVAIDQAYQRRQRDAEGEFYRKIAVQGPRNNFQGTTQGFYAASNSGQLLFYNNNRNPDRLERLLKTALEEDSSATFRVAPLATGEPDRRYSPKPPEGGLVVRVRAKVLEGYLESDNQWQKIFQSALSRDNFWITKEEHQALAEGRIPSVKFQHRLARYHLVDNTRGEPPMWKPDEVVSVSMSLEGNVLTGRATLKTANGDRSYEADLYGVVESEHGQVTRFDVVAKGLFEGHGRYTGNPPAGKFPLAVSFSLADGEDVADAIPPQGSRGWVDGYFQ